MTSRDTPGDASVIESATFPGNYNTAIGFNAGSLMAGQRHHCTLLGANTQTDFDHCIVIGENIRSTQDYEIVIGNSHIQVSRQMTKEEFDTIHATIMDVAKAIREMTHVAEERLRLHMLNHDLVKEPK